VAAWRKAHERFLSTVGAEYWDELRSELEELARVVVELEEPRKEDGTVVAASV